MHKCWRQAIILNIENGHYYELNKTGLAIWDTLEKHSNAESIADALSPMFNVESKIIKNDINNFLNECQIMVSWALNDLNDTKANKFLKFSYFFSLCRKYFFNKNLAFEDLIKLLKSTKKRNYITAIL